MTATRLLARPLLASVFVVGGAGTFKNAPAVAAKAKPAIDRFRPVVAKAAPQLPIPEDSVTLVRINAAAQIFAAVALARGKAPRLSSTVLAASLVPTTVAGHPFWQESDPAARKQHQLNFFKNLSVLGGLLLAAVDTEGRPGVAWRAKRGVSSARREARHLTREARLQAKVAAKSLG